VELLGRRLTRRALRRTGREEMRRLREQRQELIPSHDRREVYIRDSNLDLLTLKNGFGFLDQLGASSVIEAAHLRGYFLPLFDLEMRLLPSANQPSPDWEVDGTPSEFEYWILELTAAFVAKSESRDSAGVLFEPLLAFSVHARYWVEAFLHAWFRVGPGLSSSEKGFAQRWQDIAEYALSSPAWDREKSRRIYHLDDLANELIGITGSIFGSPGLRIEGEQFKGAIQEMHATFKRWCDVWLKSPRNVRNFAYFISTNAGRSLLAMGIVKLAGAVPVFSTYDWKERDLEYCLVRALTACWDHIADQLSVDSPVSKAFHELLNTLCARGLPEALLLRDKVAQS